MTIAFRCTQCGKHYEVAESLGGRRGRCKQCGHEFSIPAAAAAARTREPEVDIYGLAAEDEENEVIPAAPAAASAAKATATKAQKKGRHGPLSALPPWAYWTYVGAIIASLLGSLVARGELKLILALAGGAAAVGPFVWAGFMYRYGVPFSDGFVTGLLYIFVFPYRIHYRLTHKAAFANYRPPSITLRELIALLLGVLFLPVVILAAKEMDDLAANRKPQAPFGPFVFQAPPPAEGQPPAQPRVRPGIRRPAAIPKAQRDQPEESESAEDQPSPRRPARPSFPHIRPKEPQPAPATAPAPEPVVPLYDRHDALARDVLAKMNELADLLATVVDGASAQEISPRIRGIARGLDEDQRRFDRLPKLSADDAAKIRATYEENQKRVIERYGSEVVRIRATPGAATAVTPEPLAFRPFLPGTNLRIVVQGPAPPAMPRPGRPAAAPGAGAESSLTINVTGVTDLKAGKRITDQVTEIMKSMGANYSMRSNSGGGRTTITVSPVADVQAFADQLTFGKVTRVEGRTIDIVAGP